MIDDGVTVTGSAGVEVEPDVVVAELGVDVRAEDVTAALGEATQALERLRAALLESGVARIDLRTGQTSIWRQDVHDEQGPRTVVHAVLGLTATLRDAAAAGDLIQQALGAAGSAAQMNGISFAVSDAGEALVQAREAAFADARAVAERYALAAGRSLGQVLAVAQTGGQAPSPRMERGAATALAASVPVEGGQQSVTASVTVRWSWAD